MSDKIDQALDKFDSILGDSDVSKLEEASLKGDTRAINFNSLHTVKYNLTDSELENIVELKSKLADQTINHPAHYTSHPSGIECIQITEHMGFNLGNAVKYIWRADLKGNSSEDLKKAIWYINRELERREVEGSRQVDNSK